MDKLVVYPSRAPSGSSEPPDKHEDEQPQVSRLMQLPAELRTYIVELACFNSSRPRTELEGISVPFRTDPPFYPLQPQYEELKPRSTDIFIPPCPGFILLFVNRQLRREALYVLKRAKPSTDYELDILIVPNLGAWPTWVHAPLPKAHIPLLRTTVRLHEMRESFMFGGACGPNAGISPYALEYVKLLVRYLQQKPGVAEVSYLVHHAVCTIGTLVIDVLRPDPNPSVNRPRDILGLMSELQPLVAWNESPAALAQARATSENFAWSIWHTISRAVDQPMQYHKYWRVLLDGVSVIEVRYAGATLKKLDVWKYVEDGDPGIWDGGIGQIRIEFRQLLTEWLGEMIQRRKERGLWRGK